MPVDLTDPRLRILECTACAHPVAAIPEDRAFVATCGACGVENRRELRAVATPESSFAHGYRSAAPDPRALPDVPFARPAGMPRTFSFGDWHDLIPATRGALATATEADRAMLAQRLLWLQMTLAGGYLQRGDVLRARAALESALEDHELPFFRGLVLTRLARNAATAGANELAAAWLARLPPALEPDLAEDVWLTRALVARHTAPPSELLTQLYERTFGPNGAALAASLGVDALERLGDLRGAYRAYRVAARGRSRLVNATFTMYRLAPSTYAHAVSMGKTVLVVAFVAVLWAALALTGRPDAGFVLAVLALVGLGLAVRLLLGPRA